MSKAEETGQYTGTQDKDHNLIWFTQTCLSNALRMGVRRTSIADVDPVTA
ncbi:hypothetical protein ACQP1O_20655 [Nocardia sp. CA-151230]